MKTQFKKTKLSNFSFISFSVLVIFAVIKTFIFQGKPDISGRWNIDLSKSIFDSVKADAAPKQIYANQSPDSLVLTKTFEHPGSAPNSYTQNFYFNGKPLERMAGGGVERRVMTMLISKDTLIFNTTGYVDNQGFKWEYTATEWWTLSKDGKELTIKRKAVLPDRTEIYKAVYDKQ